MDTIKQMNTNINSILTNLNIKTYIPTSVKIIDAAAVASGITNNPVAIKMDDYISDIIVYIINTGASTDLTVNLYSSPDGIIQAPFSTCNLSTTTTTTDVPVSIVPGYLIFVASNGDAENATAYDVIVSKRA